VFLSKSSTRFVFNNVNPVFRGFTTFATACGAKEGTHTAPVNTPKIKEKYYTSLELDIMEYLIMPTNYCLTSNEIFSEHSKKRSRSSVVGIASRTRIGRSEVRIPVGEEIFLFSKTSKSALQFYWFRASFAGGKVAGA
jgi:hypothetical protein